MNKAIARCWPWLYVIDFIIHSIFRIIIPSRFGKVILCDRYLPDAIVELICETSDEHFLEKLPAKILTALIPKPSAIYVIDLDELTAYKRKADIPSIEYLRKRRKLYLKVALWLNAYILDGERKPYELHKDIMNLLSFER